MRLMANLRFFGGVNEIGGNKILLEDGDARIFLDFGMSFGQSGKYFSEFLNARKCNGIQDFIKTGLLPDLEGIYRQDYLRHMGRKKEDRTIDAVIISHAHMDHVSYVHHIRSDIEIILSPGSHAILSSLQESGRSGWQDYLTVTPSFMIKEKTRGDGYTKVTSRDGVINRPLRVLESGEKHQIGDLEIIPYAVDHSLPGATAYLIHTSEGTILYTGDFRFHGYFGHKTSEMVETVSSERIDIVITEGTRINEETGTSEQDVYDQAKEIIRGSKGLAVLTFPPRDLTRLLTFYRIAKEVGRSLVIGFRQANLLEYFSKISDEFPSVDDQNIRIFADRKGWGTVGQDDLPSNIDGVTIPQNICDQDYGKWERKYLEYPNTVNFLDLKDQSKYMLFCSYFQLNELIDINPVLGSTYLRSITEPFNDEMKLDSERVFNWLNLFDLKLFGMEKKDKLHASGHASGTEVFDMLRIIQPKSVIPIHTENPKKFQESKHNIVFVEQGKVIQI